MLLYTQAYVFVSEMILDLVKLTIDRNCHPVYVPLCLIFAKTPAMHLALISSQAGAVAWLILPRMMKPWVPSSGRHKLSLMTPSFGRWRQKDPVRPW